jgi:hypothetical protein
MQVINNYNFIISSNLAETYGTVWCHHTNENGTVYFNETTTSFCSNFMSCDSDIVGNPHPHTVKTHAHQCPEYEPTPCGYEANFWIDLSTWPISKNTVMCNRTYEDYLELPCFQIGLREGLIREIILARLGDHSGAYLDEISGDLVWNAENFIVNHCDGTLIGSDQVTAQTYFDEIKLWNGLNKCLVYGGHAKRSEKDELKRRHVVIPEDMGHSGVGVLSLGVLVLFIIIAI